jgi:hypothetical protein
LLDNDGGSGDVVGHHAAITRLDTGDFAIAYENTTDGTLKVARGSAGAWTIETVTTSGSAAGTYNSIMQLADDRIAVSYYDNIASDTRFAVREPNDVWSDLVVEGHSFTTHARPGPGSLQEYGGDLVISFIDIPNENVRTSTSADAGLTWSTSDIPALDFVFDAGTNGTQSIATSVDDDGDLWIAIDQFDAATLAFEYAGTAWSEDEV